MVAALPGPGSSMPAENLKPVFSSLERIHSAEIPVAEGMMALNVDIPSCRGDGEGGATLSRRKTATKKLETIEGEDGEAGLGADEVEDESWTYPDGGRKAWGVVAGCAVFASTSMAFGLVWGIFQEYYSQNVYTDTPLSVLSLVAGTANFTTTAFSFVAGRLGDKFGYKKMIMIGSVISVAALIGAAFSTSLVSLFIFQGFFVGLGAGCSFPLVIALPSQWFLKRRGLATGIAISGSGFGGAIMAIAMRALITRVGARYTLLFYAGFHGIAWSLAWYYLLEVREPPLRKGEQRIPKNWLPVGVWTDPVFYSLTFSIAIAIFGYLSPFYFITSFTRTTVPSIPDDSSLLALPLVVMNFSGGIGRIVVGSLADRFGPVNCLSLVFLLGGLSQLVIWTFASNFASIFVFSALYGLIGPSFLSLLPIASAQLFGTTGLATLTGFLTLASSPGQFGGAPVAGIVLTQSTGYQGVALYSGGMMLMGGLCLLYARFAREPRLFAKY